LSAEGTPPAGGKANARIQQNLLAAAERRLLNWLCARMPAWVTPDQLTALGMAGAAMTFAGYAFSYQTPALLWLAVAGYVVNWFGDSLDGSLARHRGCERPRFGYFIDHSCDALATFLILGGLGLSPYVRLEVALVVTIGYLLMSIHAFLFAKVSGEFRLSYAAAGPTELRLMLIGLTVAMYAQGPQPGWFAPVSGFDVFVGTAAAVLIGLFIGQTLMAARRLNLLDLEERLKHEG
jgi:phosphatidylglycerophosphate synthase